MSHRHIANWMDTSRKPAPAKADEPTDAMEMLRRIHRQDGRLTTSDWAALCEIVKRDNARRVGGPLTRQG